MSFAAWELAFLGLFSAWGVVVFLRIVADQARGQRERIEAEKCRKEQQAERETLSPVAIATPLKIDLPSRQD